MRTETTRPKLVVSVLLSVQLTCRVSTKPFSVPEPIFSVRLSAYPIRNFIFHLSFSSAESKIYSINLSIGTGKT
jgi:hypothetical protein